ncbi:hypothetical protein HN385_03890 [archaeon]|jgi:hypothetical protein|nr:hypothetical protein [archaeon]MBT3450890.1 hypothetical protein [archaeon]MBT6869072.1 hypothetical protein [archaeon]MBT7193315.1 hypothetical protein [archaeon]MBT7380323.1 hypothetical protein [archaeon]
MKKLLNIVALLAVFSLLLSAVVIADDTTASESISIDVVKLNGDEVEIFDQEDIDADNIPENSLTVDEGDILELKIGLEAGENVEDVEVEVEIHGYEYGDLEAESDLFDMEESTNKYVELELELPAEMDKDEYWLTVRVTDRTGNDITVYTKLIIDPVRHGMDISDVVFSPGSEVSSGRSLLTTVQVENYGGTEEEDVKVTIAIDDLGVSATDYIDFVEIDGDAEHVAYETTEEMFLSIPDCAEAGEYTVDVTVEYDHDESVTNSYALTVVDGGYCDSDSEKLIVAVGPESQSVNAGQQAVYAIALSNEGSNSETYTLELQTGDWATTSLSDSLVVLGEGESDVVYAYVNVADNAAAGSYTVSLVLENEGETLETIGLTADVVASENVDSNDFSLRNGLEIALIVLVVLLVIIGLIVGFSRLRKDDEEEEQTYY